MEVLSVRMNSTDSWTCWLAGSPTENAHRQVPGRHSGWCPRTLQTGRSTVKLISWNTSVMIPTWSCLFMSYIITPSARKNGNQTIRNAETDFHIYAMEWTADKMIAVCVDAKYFTFNNDKTNNKNTWPSMLLSIWNSIWPGEETGVELIGYRRYETSCAYFK